MAPDSNDNKFTKPEKNARRTRLVTIIKSLSVEPAGFLCVCSLVVAHLLFQNIIMDTACRVDLGYSEEDCKEIVNKVNASFKAEEREIQKVVSGIQAITSAVFGAMSVLAVLFVGPWSDQNGRRIPIIVSSAGLVSFIAMMIIYHLFLREANLSALGLLCFVMLPMVLSGGMGVLGMSFYSYIADTSKAKTRTLRTGILSASLRSGTPIGFALGGGMTKLGVGTLTSLIISLVMGFVALAILIFRVKSIKPETCPIENEKAREMSKRSAWIRYNPLVKLWESLAIIFKARKEKSVFLILIFAHICYAAPGSGEYSMLYLFVRERLQWNVSDYGFFSMYNWLMSAAGVVVSMFILSKVLKISDPLLGFIAGVSQITGSTLYAFASSALAMYLASGIDLMNGTIGVVVRSMLSKTVSPNEIGKLFALLGVLESLLPIAVVPLYALTYRNTVTWFAGGFFLLSAAITVPAEIIFLYLLCTKKGPHWNEATQIEAAAPADKEENENEPVLDQIQEMTKLMSKHNPELNNGEAGNQLTSKSTV